MKSTSHHDERIAQMTFASVYPHYITKVEKKGRSISELHQVIQWLTGYDEGTLHQLIRNKSTFAEFFESADLHPKAELITGSICGYKIQEIENPLTKKVRYLDKRRFLLRYYIQSIRDSYRNVYCNVCLGKTSGLDFPVERNALAQRPNRKTKTGVPGSP